MLNKDEIELLSSNARIGIAHYAKLGNTALESKWTNVLLKLQAMVPIDEQVTNAQFEQFNADNIKNLRETVTTNLTKLSKNNLAVKVGKINYNMNSATMELEVYPLAEGQKADKETIMKLEFTKQLVYYSTLGFTEAHFLKEFEYQGRKYEFIGFIPRGKKWIYKARQKGTDNVYRFTKDIEKLVL